MELTERVKFLKNLAIIEDKGDKYEIRLRCYYCNKNESSSGYQIPNVGYAHSKEEINEVLNKFDYYGPDRVPVCSRCCRINTWQLIINYFGRFYENDKYKMTVLANIERLVRSTAPQPNPAKFAQMLDDRGWTPTENDKKIWNMAVDECKIEYKENLFEYQVPSRWRDDKVANSILGFLGF